LDTFAFIIHPIDPKRDVSRKYPLLGRLASENIIHQFCRFFPPVYISEIEGIVSNFNGKQIKGWFIACPLTPKAILELPEKTVYRKIIETGRLAENLGANILGLGAYTSVVGDGGRTIARSLDVPVTTGDSYTVSIALQAVRRAAELMDIPLAKASAAVVGATGTIGRVCAEILAGWVAELHLIGRRPEALNDLKGSIANEYANLSDAKPRVAEIRTGTDLNKVLPEVQLIITVTSALNSVIDPEQLRPGSVVCDVARPRDVSGTVAAVRDDILVIDGGMVDVPGRVNFNFDFGLPPGKAYACMAETMILALDGKFEDNSLGKRISRLQVEEISALADKHGFRLSGFRSFERAVTPEHIEQVRESARTQKLRNLPAISI
jgi:fatty aldehyde-generating acyl-ACP reductase